MQETIICGIKELKEKDYIIKYIDEWKDELITFEDTNGSIKIFSSICPHFGGEIFLDKKKSFSDANGILGNFVKKLENAYPFL